MSLWFALLALSLPQSRLETTVLAETGRDYPVTRLFTACQADLNANQAPFLIVGGFTDTGHGDVSDVSVYALAQSAAHLRWRAMWQGDIRSSIRTVRAADLDGDGHEEVIVLGRMGNEDVDSEAELRVLGLRKGGFNVIDAVHWQSGTYTHGYGMAIGDLDGDGTREIVSGGFFSDGQHERAEIRVWQLRRDALQLVSRAHWGESGETRINAVEVGDIAGDGRMEIFTAGRTGQVKDAEGNTTGERGQITAWRLDGTQLQRVAAYEPNQDVPYRFRELMVADVDGDRRPEIFAAGRYGEEMRPYLGLFRLGQQGFQLISEPKWEGERLGEVRDVASFGQGDAFRIVTIGAEGIKPNRQGQMRIWKLVGPQHDLVQDWLAVAGDENRVRSVVIWPARDRIELVTVGFVRNGKQQIGQIVHWGKVP